MVSSRPVFKLKPGEDPGSRPNPGPEKVPSRYNGKLSELECDVKADSSHEFDFTLDTKKP